jgi:hypothetical protein
VTVKRVGYCKPGRAFSINLNDANTVGGDADVARLIDRLARRHPNVEFVLTGRNDGTDPATVGLANVTNPWTRWIADKRVPMVNQTPKTGKLAVLWGGEIMSHAECATRLMARYRELFGDLPRQLDGVIAWAGQHGTCNNVLPKQGFGWETWPDGAAHPQVSFMNYNLGAYQLINDWRDFDPLAREEVWLVPDPRNYIKCRDLKWPWRHPHLAQYDRQQDIKWERYRSGPPPTGPGEFPPGKMEGTYWCGEYQLVYAGVELMAIPEPLGYWEFPFEQRVPFGMVVNEGRKYVGPKHQRGRVVREWVIDQAEPYLRDAPIHGSWLKESVAELGREKIEPIPYRDLFGTLQRYRSTLTTPSSGSGWATCKPWECFSVQTICFFHPLYDDQGHIILTRQQLDRGEGTQSLRDLSDFLRPRSPEELYARVKSINNDANLWYNIAQAQRRRLVEQFARWSGGCLEVERRLGLG